MLRRKMERKEKKATRYAGTGKCIEYTEGGGGGDGAGDGGGGCLLLGG